MQPARQLRESLSLGSLGAMTNRFVYSLALFLSVFATLRSTHATEVEDASLNTCDTTHAFSDGVKVRIIASGIVNAGYGMGVLELKMFQVFLNGERIDEKKFDRLCSTPGVKLETIRVSREAYTDTPETFKTLYRVTFDCMAQAYVSPESPSDIREKMSVEFDQTGIKRVIKTSSVSKEVPLK